MSLQYICNESAACGPFAAAETLAPTCYISLHCTLLSVPILLLSDDLHYFDFCLQLLIATRSPRSSQKDQHLAHVSKKQSKGVMSTPPCPRRRTGRTFTLKMTVSDHGTTAFVTVGLTNIILISGPFIIYVGLFGSGVT